MTKFLISFPSAAMVLTPDELAAAADESHAVIERAKEAGVYVFGGGIDEEVDPVLVAADGAVSTTTHPGSVLTGGFLVLEAAGRDEAVLWASRIAAACRCSQEVREFMHDPAS